jgi:hypothetical protein
MAKGNYIQFRCTEEFKAQIGVLASKQNRTISNYIEDLVKRELDKENQKKK